MLAPTVSPFFFLAPTVVLLLLSRPSTVREWIWIVLGIASIAILLRIPTTLPEQTLRAAGAFFTGTVGTLGANFVWEIGHTEQVSADLEMPMWIVYLAVPLGSYLMCFRFLQVAWAFLKTGELPKHDHAHVEGIDEVVGTDAVPGLHPADLKAGGKA